MITVAPPAARAFAVTLPMPELAPVTRQICSFIFSFSIFHITFVIYHCRASAKRRGGSPTVREGIVAASEPSLTVGLAATRLRRAMEIGRASCRERGEVCEIGVGM